MVWYTLSEEEDLLTDASASNYVEVDVLGSTGTGNDIRRVRVGRPPPASSDRTVFLTGCVHGNEPAGRQALLDFITEVTNVGPYLTLTGTSGDYASTPDDASLRITGDISLRAEVAVDDWDDGLQALGGRYVFTTDDRSYRLTTNSSGGIRLYWSTDGATFETVDSDALPSTDAERLAVRADLDVDNGSSEHEVTFFTAPSRNGPWTQLGSTQTFSGTTSIFAGTSDLEVGSSDDGTSNRWSGKVYAFQVHDGTTLVADLDFEEQALSATSFDDNIGLTWTVHGSASIDSDYTADQLDFLENSGFIIVPTVNPDGFDAGNRVNGNSVDINRDFMVQTQTETQLVSTALMNSRPVLFVDHHEAVNLIDPSSDIEVNAARPAQAHQLMKDNAVVLRDQMLARATSEGWPNDVFGSTFRGDIRILDINTALRHATSCIIETNYADDTTSGREHRVEMHAAMIEEIFDFVTTEFGIGQLAEDSNTAETDKIAEGEDGTEPFDLRGGVILDPPPLAYDLTDSQIETISHILDVFDITFDHNNRVLMAQQSQPYIPYVLDDEAQHSLVDGDRVFDLTPGTGEPATPGVPESFLGEPNYRYVFGDARTGLITAEIPLYGVSMNTLLNAGYDFSGSFSADMTGFRNQDLFNATEPGRTFVVAERDGFPVWDGNVVAQLYQAQAKNCQLFARSLSGYPDKVKMDASYFPDGFVVEDMDQTEAFLLLWEVLQSAPESDLRVQLPQPLDTGVTVTMDVQPYEDKYFGDVMDQIANGDQGFDWRIVTTKIDNQYARIMQIGYPTLGREDANRLVFEYPGPMMNYWRTAGVNDSGTHTHGLGSGQGEDMVRADFVHQDLLDNGYLRWDYDVQLKDVTDPNVLSALTLQEAIKGKTPRRTYVVETKGNQQPQFGSYLQGDACILKIEDPAHPDGVRFPTRIIGWRVTPPSGSTLEKIAVYFEGGSGGV